MNKQPELEDRLKPDTRVRTSLDLDSTDWRADAIAARRNNVTGVVLAHHDSHGLYYDVRHDDGSIGYYEHQELTKL